MTTKKVDRCLFSAMTSDDRCSGTNEILACFPDVLAKYQDRFRYIMVEDIKISKPPQYHRKSPADRFQNICMAGDEFSTKHHSFRGANIQNIFLSFQKIIQK